MKVLVTGGTGYIGSHTVVELQNNGYHPVIIDNLSNSNANVVERIEKISGKKPDFEKIDLCDSESLKKFFDNQKDIESVIHFAAFKAVGESVNDPLKYYKNNVDGMINLLKELTERGINNFVYSSSCTVYGEADKLPVTEDSPIKKAESPYGFTKQIGEQILFDLSKVSGLNTIILRYFNPTGAHNLGTGKGNSVMEVINSFEEVSGLKLKFRIGPRRSGDVVSIYSDTKKANELLNWKAERDLNNMMLTSWNWEKTL
ncbi:MAG: NAD-dependent epimerase/dehydratase family protein [Ignavibacteria bacterium]|nr:NAD-dependent epimerase/dehydratase family protein [Ignavibacteria bacterium]